jgi:hypothetical protein
MADIPALHTYVDGDVLTASQLNSDYSAIRTAYNSGAVQTDKAATITVTHVFSVAQTFSAGITVTGTITMATTASKIVPGATSLALRNHADSANNLLVSDAGAVTTRSALTVTAGGITVTAGDLTLSSGGITLSGSITGLTSLAMAGALSGVTTLAASGVVSLAATGQCLTFNGASPQIRAGSTGLDILNHAGSANLLRIAQANGMQLLNANNAMTIDLGYGGGTAMVITNTGGNIELGGASATTATVNLPRMPQCAGTPTGVVSNGTFILDTTAHKLWIYDGSWKYVTLT